MKQSQIFLLASLLVAACAEETDEHGQHTGTIAFQVADATTVTVSTTRGVLTGNSAIGTASFTFGVSEFSADDASTPVSGFSNVRQTSDDYANDLYHSGQSWPASAYTGTAYKFYAYSPYVSQTANGITPNWAGKTITYDAAGVAAGNQPDLMTAYTSSDYAAAVPLTFQHRLCAVQLKLGESWVNGYTITAISLSNIISSGTLNIHANKDEAWPAYGSRSTYTVTGFNETANTAGSVVAGDGSTYLMMIPQMLTGNDVTMSVTLTDNAAASHTLTARLTGEWQAGQVVTYLINPQGVSIWSVSYPAGWNDSGATVSGPVMSYTNAEAFGLFAVSDGAVVSDICNLRVTAATAGACPGLNLPSGHVYSNTYTYFLYYPYKANLQGSVNPAAVTAEEFFSGVTRNWTVEADQNDFEALKRSDLQIGMLSGLTFSMTHQMGMLAAEQVSQTVDDVIYYDGNSGISSWTKLEKSTTLTWHSSTDFTSTSRPYNGGAMLYYVAKPSAGPTFTAAAGPAGSCQYGWNLSGTNTTITSANEYKQMVIPPYSGKTFTKKVWEFAYKGSIQTWTAPHTGTYTLQVYGAQGGSNYVAGGQGGYAGGDLTNWTAGGSLYVCVGGQGGADRSNRGNAFDGGYNGGGSTAGAYDWGGGGGGGATHIATTSRGSGLLADYTSNRSEVLIVAGGGGGSGFSVGGTGGGETGGHGYCNQSAESFHGRYSAGGTQTTGYAFGTGQNAIYSSDDGSGGGGGGWYGGYSFHYDATTAAEDGVTGYDNYDFGGGGGSGYVGGVANSMMQNGLRTGNGYAEIILVQ